MASLLKTLPEGGETIYEAVRVWRWLIEHYTTYAKGVSNLFFLDRLEGEKDRRRYDRLMEAHTRNVMRFLTGKEYAPRALGRHYMAYGTWVEHDLYPALFNRLEIIAHHPKWATFNLEDRVRLTGSAIFETVLWCGILRAAAWKGESACRETPFTFVDRLNNRHTFDIISIPSVRRFGPEPEKDAGT